MRQKTQAQIALQSDSVARDERFGFLEFFVTRNLMACVSLILYTSLECLGTFKLSA